MSRPSFSSSLQKFTQLHGNNLDKVVSLLYPNLLAAEYALTQNNSGFTDDLHKETISSLTTWMQDFKEKQKKGEIPATAAAITAAIDNLFQTHCDSLNNQQKFFQTNINIIAEQLRSDAAQGSPSLLSYFSQQENQ